MGTSRSPLKGVAFTATLPLIGIGELLEAGLGRVGVSTEWGTRVGDGVFGEFDGEVHLGRKEEEASKGVGRIPGPDWKVLQLISLK